MQTPKPKRRVAYTAISRSQHAYGGLRGMLDYKERNPHWQLVCDPFDPFIQFPQLNLDALDGVIGFFHERSWADAINAAGVPAVNISNRFSDLPLPLITNDDEAVGRLGAEHLLERGFVNLGFFSISNDWLVHRRYAGFKNSVKRRGTRECFVFEFDTNQTITDPIIDQWLHSLPKPIGILASMDTAARQLIRRATEIGLKVPDDVAVLGVNNERWMVHIESVSMSSIELNERRVGFLAAELLDALMDGKPRPPKPVFVPPLGVVMRGSTEIVIAEDPVVAKALKFISERCGDGIGVEDVLDELRISRRNFELKLKRAIGQSPRMAIFRAQIERAKKLLLTSNAPMHRISEQCGFEYEPRFYVVFKRLTGTTPGEYRRRYRFNEAESSDEE